jgi:site-specific DNA recombinase
MTFTTRHAQDDSTPLFRQVVRAGGSVVRVTYTPLMRYFIYCRKSSEAEDRQVLSIDSQESEAQRVFSGRADIEVVHIFHEAFSAKAPGRAIFDEMLRRIEKGEAEGIIAWHPDRLARNSLDGGRLIFLLDQGKLKDLKFANFAFDNNAQGKFMLSIIFGYSKYYVDNLSENVKRGNRAKIARGWRPNMAPLGYLNDKEARTIVPDPERFPLLRRLFDLALSGSYSLVQLRRETMAMGLRTVQHKRIGGNWLAVSGIHRILTNPFYTGLILWKGAIHPGAHKALISHEEFERTQRQLRRPAKERPAKYRFPFTGLIRCGECGFAVTAEMKTNRHGTTYTYYHCSKRRLDYHCSQRSISGTKLEEALLCFLANVHIAPRTFDYLVQCANDARATDAEVLAQQRAALHRSLDGFKQSLKNLTALRVRDLIGDEEFVAQRTALQKETLQTEEHIRKLDRDDAWFEPAHELFSFSSRTVDLFKGGDDSVKRQILRSVGSNPYLRDQKLSIEAKKPLFWYASEATSSYLRARVEEVRIAYLAQDSVLMETLQLIRDIRRQLPPHLLDDSSPDSASHAKEDEAVSQ